MGGSSGSSSNKDSEFNESMKQSFADVQAKFPAQVLPDYLAGTPDYHGGGGAYVFGGADQVLPENRPGREEVVPLAERTPVGGGGDPAGAFGSEDALKTAFSNWADEREAAAKPSQSKYGVGPYYNRRS